MSKNFAHLHVHSEYSLLDGLPKIKALVRKTKELGMDSVAITDHGSLYGAVEFFKEAKKQGVNPIVGIEAYSTKASLKKKPEKRRGKNNHLILLVKDGEGYRNLMKLSSIAHLEGYYYRPRVDRDTLKKYSKGLICASGCPQGEIPQFLVEGNYKEAKKDAEWFLKVFKKDFYLEIQRHEYDKFIEKSKNNEIKQILSKWADEEKIINEGLVKLSRDLGIPLIATNDVHYLNKEDALAQDILLCVSTGKNVDDTKRLRMVDSPTFYLKSPKEMRSLFSELPDAIENTVKVTEKCNLEISTLGKWFFPNFPVPKGYTAEKYLKKLAHDRLKKKVSLPDKEALKRLNYELDIIIKKGYAPYFLIFMDLVNWANKKGIITNTRGSAAGSLVSYVLGITTVNPLTYYLPFERFLNPFRPLPPDIDVDIADDRREDMINYIVKKYGRDKVAQICTFGRMLSRAAVRDVARVLGHEYSVGDRIAKLIPPPKQGFPIDIPKALSENQQLFELYKSDSVAKRILDIAKQVEGSARHISVHAAGIVISPSKMTEFSPVQREPSGDKIITQYEMHSCEDIGLIQLDILGIRNLSILGSAIKIVEEARGKKINLREISLKDKKTFEMLGRGETMGTFQLGGSGMTRYLTELKPSRIEDLMVMVALYRPGPMQVIPEYIARKRDPKRIKYLDPRMKKFLDKSYGLIVYQDDLLFCALELAGYNWQEADKFRKAVGKKIPEEMAAQKEKFMKGIVENGQTKKFAEELWTLFEPFQAYGFNKAHAASYGMIAYQTAYMKANYPVEFMAALLTAESSNTEKITLAINECRRMKIKVLTPDISKSAVGFMIEEDSESLEDRAIRFGLNAIKNVGKAAIEAILEARKDGAFLSYADFLSKVDSRKVNKKVVESLIKVGAMSSFGKRAALLSSLDEIRNKVSRPKDNAAQQGLFSKEELAKNTSSVSSPLDSQVEEFSEEELQSLEKQLLGFSLSARPIEEVIGGIMAQATHRIFEIANTEVIQKNVKIAAVISEVKMILTKRTGQEMAFVRVDDGTGAIDLVVFPNLFVKTKEYWIENKAVLVTGKLDTRDDGNSLIVESIELESDQMGNKAGIYYISVPKGASAKELNELKRLLSTNPGDKPVKLIFEGKQETYDTPFRIEWSEKLAKSIADILKSN